LEIKIGIVDEDNYFVKRFSEGLTSKYSDVRVFPFPSIKSAQTAAKKFGLNILLVDVKKEDPANFTIPMQCEVLFISTEKQTEESLSTICKYKSVEEWYNIICDYCRCDKSDHDQGGRKEESQKTYDPVYLFLPCGDNTGATTASTKFCHFLYENGFGKMAVFEPFFESGENVWKAVESLLKNCDGVILTENNWNDENMVIPVINSKAIVLVSDGTTMANETIENFFYIAPKETLLPREEIIKKTCILYNNFDIKRGTLNNNENVIKLGGLGNDLDNKASFEKMVTIFGVRRNKEGTV